jgi:isopenicillin N synthase-like dioxygenase
MNERLSEHIPFVDLPFKGAPWNAETTRHAAGAIDDACRKFGYFFLSNHGIPTDPISATFKETGQFYSRPLEEKSRYNCSANSQFLGYRGLGAEKSLTHSGAEACEQYRIGNIVATSPSSRSVNQEFFHEPFRSGMILFEEMVKVGDRLMSTCATGLGMTDTFFDGFMEAPLHRLGLNFYKVGAGQEIGNSVSYAMSPHVDHAVFTILVQDQPGLEVVNSEGEWIDVPVVPNALFVFLGNYFQIWTNGNYRATMHRVREVCKDRISIQYKHKPSYATVVAPLAQFVNEGAPARYEPFDTGHQYEELLQSLLAKYDAGREATR